MCFATKHSTAQCVTLHCSTAQHSTSQHSTSHYITMHRNTSHDSIAQHSMAQHGTAWHSTAWLSTAQHTCESVNDLLIACHSTGLARGQLLSIALLCLCTSQHSVGQTVSKTEEQHAKASKQAGFDAHSKHLEANPKYFEHSCTHARV